MPLGKPSPVATTLAVPSGSTQMSTVVQRGAPPMRSNPKLPTQARAVVIDQHVVQMPRGETVQVSMGDKRTVGFTPQDLAIAHGHDQHPAIGQEPNP